MKQLYSKFKDRINNHLKTNQNTRDNIMKQLDTLTKQFEPDFNFIDFE